VVHCSDCGVSKRLFERDPDRWIAVEWSDELSRSFEAGVAVLLNNSKGALGRVASAVSEAEADITHIDMGDEPASDVAELQLLLSVRDRLHLADVLRTLKRSSAVLRVNRIKG
jgi:GTP pyrophosphokinase/guanosine-3',5'-bis(diphosphate) 3'-pyrophosphohydrolase